MAGAAPADGAAGPDSSGVTAWTVDSFRAEVARCLHQAARQGLIPRTFRAHRRAMVIDFTRPGECLWYAGKLARSDSRLWWAAVNLLPGHYPGIQPQIGQAIGALRQLQAAQDEQVRHAQALHELRQRLFGPVTPAWMPQHRPEKPEPGCLADQ
jgi:hypothetical protein